MNAVLYCVGARLIVLRNVLDCTFNHSLESKSTSDVMKHCYLLLLSQSDSRMVKYCVFIEFMMVLNANKKHKNSKYFWLEGGGHRL